MAESALQRLLRLKKEKENGISTLAAVSGEVSEAGTRGESSGEGDNSNQREQLLSPEATELSESTSVLAVVHSDNVSLVECVSNVVAVEIVAPVEAVPEVPAKPMSAMDRLRALKSGGVKSNGVAGNNEPASERGAVVSLNANPVEAKLEVVKILKERKTHPIAMEMAELEAAIDAEVPGFVSILSQIHKKLRADPDVVTLLADEEIGVIVAGLEKHTNVTIVAPSAIKAAKSKAKKEPVSAMDL